jgi:hypothetical protein
MPKASVPQAAVPVAAVPVPQALDLPKASVPQAADASSFSANCVCVLGRDPSSLQPLSLADKSVCAIALAHKSPQPQQWQQQPALPEQQAQQQLALPRPVVCIQSYAQQSQPTVLTRGASLDLIAVRLPCGERSTQTKINKQKLQNKQAADIMLSTNVETQAHCTSWRRIASLRKYARGLPIDEMRATAHAQ